MNQLWFMPPRHWVVPFMSRGEGKCWNKTGNLLKGKKKGRQDRVGKKGREQIILKLEVLLKEVKAYCRKTNSRVLNTSRPEGSRRESSYQNPKGKGYINSPSPPNWGPPWPTSPGSQRASISFPIAGWGDLGESWFAGANLA